jgi:hypothetical protein
MADRGIYPGDPCLLAGPEYLLIHHEQKSEHLLISWTDARIPEMDS